VAFRSRPKRGRIGLRLLAVVAAATTALLTACGGQHQSTEVTLKRVSRNTSFASLKAHRSPNCPPPSRKWHVSVDGREGAPSIGILTAKNRGFFEDVGIDVWVGSPEIPNRPVHYVADGTDDLGVAQLPQVVLAKEKGIPIVAIGSVISEPTAAMIWLKKSDIHSIADLEGKTIGFPGIPFQEKLLKFVLGRAGMTLQDVNLEPVAYGMVRALLRGKVDAIFGGSENVEGAVLKTRGASPVIRRVQALGVPGYDELVVVARSRCVARYPRLIRAFMSAVARGTKAAIEDPRRAVRLIERDPESMSELSWRETEAQVKATLPLLSRSGYIDPRQADDLVAWMSAHGLAWEEPPVAGLFTNDYLASHRGP
jgi:putative hydroxymethylpyrimidine transport system substrate-binding protein